MGKCGLLCLGLSLCGVLPLTHAPGFVPVWLVQLVHSVGLMSPRLQGITLFMHFLWLSQGVARQLSDRVCC